MALKDRQTRLEALTELTTQPEEKLYLSLPLFVTYSRSREPLDMKSSGILASILSSLKIKCTCLKQLLKPNQSQH